ncbi:uncharacterized protein [Trachinotus anak]|uniref:uncharacterized protein n=1 Tax=Trachinotus anak TaxID=443729 RepID=UPI0039F2261D
MNSSLLKGVPLFYTARRKARRTVRKEPVAGDVRRVVRSPGGAEMLHLCVSFAILGLCAAQNIQCTVTQDAGRTTYNVPKFNQTGCEYSWTNSTDFTLANHLAKTDLVVTKSGTTLTINECIEKIKYKRDCISEKINREMICRTNCSGPTGLPMNGQVIPQHWIVCIVVIPLLLLLLMGLFWCCRSRCQTSRSRVENPDPSSVLLGRRTITPSTTDEEAS